MATVGSRSDKCSICKDSYTDPRYLPCGHIFCVVCVHPLISEDILSCPTCQVKTHVSTVADLPKAEAIQTVELPVQDTGAVGAVGREPSPNNVHYTSPPPTYDSLYQAPVINHATPDVNFNVKVSYLSMYIYIYIYIYGCILGECGI